MKFESLIENDLPLIGHLQPEGWSSIVPEFEFYIKSGFCNPVKAVSGKTIVGVGCSVSFGKSGWLAHIIVDIKHRNRGIGYSITNKLLDDLHSMNVESNLLIATEAGYPVYLKAGFRPVTEYLFFKRVNAWLDSRQPDNIVPLTREYYPALLKIDSEISGEKRDLLISLKTEGGMIYLADNHIEGYYLPALGEGTIMAMNTQAGCELMRIKYARAEKAVLPSGNLSGIEFLEKNGFARIETRGVRMIKGIDINWKPEKIFSRTGGNFG